MNKNFSVTFSAIAFTLSLTQLSFASEDFVEAGRFGVEGLVSENGFQFGLVRFNENFEAALDLDGMLSKTGDLTSHFINIELRLGKRFNIGNFNYLSVGADGIVPIFSMSQGVATNGSYSVGPYIGFQRYFPNTNIMLSLYVSPYQYSYIPALSESSSSTTNHEFFQNGGFGITYLF